MEEEWKQNKDIFQLLLPDIAPLTVSTAQTLVEYCILWWELDCAKISRQGRVKNGSSWLNNDA